MSCIISYDKTKKPALFVFQVLPRLSCQVLFCRVLPRPVFYEPHVILYNYAVLLCFKIERTMLEMLRWLTCIKHVIITKTNHGNIPCIRCLPLETGYAKSTLHVHVHVIVTTMSFYGRPVPDSLLCT